MKATQTTKTPFHDAMLVLSPKIAAVRAELAAVVAERLRRSDEERDSPSVTAESVKQREALSLLNGAGEDLPRPKRQRRTFRELLDRQAVLERANALGCSLHEQLRLKSLGERSEFIKDDFAELTRQQCCNLLAVEQVQAALDTLCKGSATQPFLLPPQLGRLSNSGSGLYGFLERCCRGGYLSAKVLGDAFHQARSAHRDRPK